eukprot:5345835-Amphidinium_carterae.1
MAELLERADALAQWKELNPKPPKQRLQKVVLKVLALLQSELQGPGVEDASAAVLLERDIASLEPAGEAPPMEAGPKPAAKAKSGAPKMIETTMAGSCAAFPMLNTRRS